MLNIFFWAFGYLSNSLLCIVRKVAAGRSVAEAVGTRDRQYVLMNINILYGIFATICTHTEIKFLPYKIFKKN